jgi:hypothetical protein
MYILHSPVLERASFVSREFKMLLIIRSILYAKGSLGVTIQFIHIV